MRRLPLLIALALLLPLTAARAEDELPGPQEAPVLALIRTTVLASPGTPSALHAFLPGGTRPGTLVWPLPQGSLLVLGLPAQDERARRICDVFQLDVDDLGGGYKIWAWRANKRPMVFVMGADPAALQAARFEFDADAPMEMLAPDMRSLDFRRPNEEAAVVVRMGTRHVKPRYRMRAWAPGERRRRGDAVEAAEARANRVWIETREDPNAETVRTVAALRAQGVTPVIAAGVYGQLTDASATTWAKATTATLRAWQKTQRIRHFALIFDATESSVRTEGGRAAAREARIVKAVADALRPGGLAELVVVPRCHSDRLARASAPPPDLRHVPEVVIAWSGPHEHSTHITRAQAERRVRAAGIPVVLLETWAAPTQAGADLARVPTMPGGRAQDLHEVLDGIVIVARQQAAPLLESAWERVDSHRLGLELLRPLIPADGDDPAAFAHTLMERLRASDKENLGLVPWMAPMAAALRDAVWVRDGKPNAAAVPVIPQRITADGRIDERPWGFARKLVGGARGAEVFVLSDGDALRFAVRVRKAAVGTTPFLLQLTLEARGRTDRWHVEVTRKGAQVDSSGREGMPNLERGHAEAAWRESKTHYTAEVTFDRFALGGEPHAGRLFDCGVSWGPENLWPAGPANGVTGTLLVTR